MTATPLSFFFMAITILTSWYMFEKPSQLDRYVFNPYRIKREKQYYRFVSSGFIHAGWMHLIFNMFTFFFFARSVEHHYVSQFGLLGYLYFILVYIGGIIISDIPTYLKHKDAPHYNALGASGGVASILFAYILFFPLSEICLYGLLCLPGFIWALVYVIYSHVYNQQGSGDRINHSAHLYGALYGFGVATAIEPMSIFSFIEQLSTWRLF